MPIIHSRYNLPPQVSIAFLEPTLAQQHFADEVNINSIIAKYNATGFLVDPTVATSRMPQYGDFSDVVDYHTAQTAIATANQNFALLPSAIRKRFNNDPAELLQFLEKEENRDEAVTLGLINPLPDTLIPDGNAIPDATSAETK